MSDDLNLNAFVAAQQNCPSIIGRLHSIFHVGSKMTDHAIKYNLAEALAEAKRVVQAIEVANEACNPGTAVIIAEAAE